MGIVVDRDADGAQVPWELSTREQPQKGMVS